MEVFRLWSFYRVFLGLCFVLAVILLSTELFLSFDSDDTPYDGSVEAVNGIQWQDDSIRIKEDENRIFNFLDVDENWKERYSEGVLLRCCS